MPVLSVDLGTSNTVAVLSAHGQPPRVVEVDGAPTMPSAVFAEEDGTLVVGDDARRRARLDPARYEPHPKRRVDEGTLLLGRTVVTVTDALAAVLYRVGFETRRQLDGGMPERVLLTHPAQWGQTRCNVLLAAARLAGLGTDVALIPEPVAAAAHFASFPDRELNAGQALGIYDLGAGTFDCAVVGATTTGFSVRAENGLPDLGGLDVDQALLDHVGRQVSHRDPDSWQRLLRPAGVADRRDQRTLHEDVRAAKESLSRHSQTEVAMPQPFSDVLITRIELEALIRPTMLRSVELLAATIRAAGMTPHGLAGLYLVGGASRVPLVAGLIGEQLRVVATSLDQPETAVALGAHHVPAPGDVSEEATVTGGEAVASPPGEHDPTHVAAPVHSQARAPEAADGGGGGPPGVPPPVWNARGPHPGDVEDPTERITPVVAGTPAATPTRGRRRSRGTLLAAAAAAALLLVATVTTALAAGGVLGGNEHPTARDCATVGAAHAGGFNPCLRQLAGRVPAGHHCTPGMRADQPGLGDLRGISTTCELDRDPAGATVSYTHVPPNDVAARADLLLNFNGAHGTRVEANWAGNGLRGRYRAVVGDHLGTLVFTVDGRPLIGTLMRPNHGHLTPDALADEFARTVQPGS